MSKYTINQCERIAKKNGFNSLAFVLHGPAGEKKCKWIDAYMGIFEIEGLKGLVMTRQVEMMNDVWYSISTDSQ